MLDGSKPRVKLRTIITMSNDIVEREEAGVPAWLRERSTGASIGNIDGSDLKPPRLKVLAGQSPEVMDGVPGAVPGSFWVTILNQNLGKTVVGTPILLRKTYQVWAPRAAGATVTGPLAVASDGIHWDAPDQTFDVKFPDNNRIYKWRIGKMVTDFGATKFGSQQDDNPNSKPIATLTYDVLWLIDLPNGQKQLCVFTNKSTGVTPTQNFVSTTKAMGIDFFYQRYKILIVRKENKKTGDPYFTYDYQYVSTVGDEAACDFTKSLYDQYRKSGFITDMEAEAADIDSDRASKRRPAFEATDSDSGDDIPF
jgi:hypothetical protein